MKPIHSFSPACSSRTVATFGVCLLALSFNAHAGPVSVTNLVTDDQTVNAAQITDADLINPWGVSFGATGPFWVSDNGTRKTTLYSVSPISHATTKLGLVVTLPGTGPTGQVFNPTTQFNGNAFLFVNEDGTISGWRGALGTTAETLQVADPSNLYKGAAFATVNGNGYLYAADFKSAQIDVRPGATGAPQLAGSFTDPNLPSGFAPFNIQNIGGSLYVAYAKQDPNSPDEVAGPGNGFVSKFDVQGNFLERIASGGTLNAPWGMALAPSSFGTLAGDLLVGNFGDGAINVFDLATKTFVGQLQGTDGNPVHIDGLWALTQGNDGSGGGTDSIFFTAGPGDETHGLFGMLTPVPEPGTYALLVAGLMLLGYVQIRYRRKKHV